ncbi:hypothetical protein FB446DRAFT_252892 [Lentinula raphanica]|nr:hypothetical protein FB446DRAFT_252892 [Lentinula raphanica]
MTRSTTRALDILFLSRVISSTALAAPTSLSPHLTSITPTLNASPTPKCCSNMKSLSGSIPIPKAAMQQRRGTHANIVPRRLDGDAVKPSERNENSGDAPLSVLVHLENRDDHDSASEDWEIMSKLDLGPESDSDSELKTHWEKLPLRPVSVPIPQSNRNELPVAPEVAESPISGHLQFIRHADSSMVCFMRSFLALLMYIYLTCLDSSRKRPSSLLCPGRNKCSTRPNHWRIT